MIRVRSVALLLPMVLLGFLPRESAAEKVTVPMKSKVDVREASRSLRMAVDAFEDAARRPLPDRWTRATLTRGKSLQFGHGCYLLLQASEGPWPKILFLDAQGPQEAVAGPGQEAKLGPLKVIVVSHSADRRQAEILFRAAEAPPLLLPLDPTRRSALIIMARPESGDILLESSSLESLDFAVAFLDGINSGQTPEEAAGAARASVAPKPPATSETDPVPPQDPAKSASPLEEPRVPYRVPDDQGAPKPAQDRNPAEAPLAAKVDFIVVRGDEGTLSALNSSIEYQSEGQVPESPSVSATGGGPGTTVRVGRPGDRFQAQLEALEASRKVNVENRIFLRVPLGMGGASLSVTGPAGGAEAWVTARLRGQNAVELDVKQRGGDWSFLGAVSTRVRIRSGQTILLARNTLQRTQTTRSGVPILGSIPYLGPVFGRQTKVVESNSYALYATVNLE